MHTQTQREIKRTRSLFSCCDKEPCPRQLIGGVYLGLPVLEEQEFITINGTTRRTWLLEQQLRANVSICQQKAESTMEVEHGIWNLIAHSQWHPSGKTTPSEPSQTAPPRDQVLKCRDYGGHLAQTTTQVWIIESKGVCWLCIRTLLKPWLFVPLEFFWLLAWVWGPRLWSLALHCKCFQLLDFTVFIHLHGFWMVMVEGGKGKRAICPGEGRAFRWQATTEQLLLLAGCGVVLSLSFKPPPPTCLWEIRRSLLLARHLLHIKCLGFAAISKERSLVIGS